VCDVFYFLQVSISLSLSLSLSLFTGDGRYCYDAIACALGVTVEEVEDECERGPHKDEILVIARMSFESCHQDGLPEAS